MWWFILGVIIGSLVAAALIWWFVKNPPNFLPW